MSLQSLSKICANHSDRPAAAICVECRRSICQECATRWDGINYCVGCLAGKRQAVESRQSALRWIPVLLVTAALYYGSSWLMVWMGALVAGLF